jgi:hypothetical protein
VGSILPSSLALFALTAALGWGSCGCSFIFVRGPPSEPKHRRVIDCTTSQVAPILDSVFGGLEGVRIGIAAAASDSAYQNALISRDADIGLGIGFAALFVGSAVYGFVETGRCSDLKEKFESAEDEPDSVDKYEGASTAPSAKHVPSSVRPTASSVPAAESAPAASAAPPRSFDAQAARVAIEKALGVAAASCLPSGGKHVEGVATMTYATDGRPSEVRLEPLPQDATVGGCIANALRDAHVPPFDGEAAAVKKRFDLGP